MAPLDYGRDLPTVRDTYANAEAFAWHGDEGETLADWRVLPVSLARDATPLCESNFEAAQLMLGEAGASYEVHRFGHWAIGWYEVIVVAPDDESLAAAGKIACALDSYPILDESDLCEREMEDQDRAWRDYAAKDYVDSLPSISDAASDLVEEYLLHIGPHSAPGMRYVEQLNDGPHFTYDVQTRDETAQLLRAARKWKREGGA